MAALAGHLEKPPPALVAVEDRTDPRKDKRKTRKARLIFTEERGEPVARYNWSRYWGYIVRAANQALTAQYETAQDRWEGGGREGDQPVLVQVPEGTTMHDLRHFYASVLIKHRESVKTVQKRLGHAKPSITLDTYTHLWPDEEDTTRAAIDAVFSAVPSMCPVGVAA